MNNFLNSVDNNPLEELKIFSGRFISIGVLAKYPERLKEYLEDLEINCFDKKNFEVVVVIPDDEEVQKNFINAVSKIRLKIRIERLPYGYLNSMKSHNMMIEKFSDQNTYFYINNSDRVRFACKNWDLIIKQYINYRYYRFFFPNI